MIFLYCLQVGAGHDGGGQTGRKSKLITRALQVLILQVVSISSFPQESVHFCSASHNVSLSALSIKDPDCHGWLYKQGHGLRPWRRRYCVLKSHQLFYYGKMSHRTAYGVLNLDGYRVVRGKSKEKKFCFSIVPADKSEKEYHFYTETDVERDRYILSC